MAAPPVYPGDRIGTRFVAEGPLAKVYERPQRLMWCPTCQGTRAVDASLLRTGAANSCQWCYRKKAKRGG